MSEEKERLSEKIVEATKRLEKGLEEAAKKLGEVDIPRLSRNIMVLSITAMGIYTSAIAISTMLPLAAIVFQQMGIIFGFFIPMMIMMTLASVLLTFVRKALER